MQDHEQRIRRIIGRLQRERKASVERKAIEPFAQALVQAHQSRRVSYATLASLLTRELGISIRRETVRTVIIAASDGPPRHA